jgi:ribosomal-protein-alanine N-acetyltransferase
VIVRRAGEPDVPALVRLEQALFGPDAWSEQSVRAELSGPRRTAVVACAPEVVGYAVTAEAGDVSDLHRIAVHPAYRRRGVARLLLAEVRPAGRRLLLEVSALNEAALAFYAAEGFTEAGRRRAYYRDGSDAVLMQCDPELRRRPGDRPPGSDCGAAQ